jgi:hypothetical protein
MKKFMTFAFVAALVLLAGGARSGEAQVRRVRMKIDGYLCGN